MKRRMMAMLGLVGVVAAGIGTSAWADRIRIDSQWRDRAITVDGVNDEWLRPLVQIDEKTPVALAASNDGQFLYLALTASDAAARAQIMREGLVIWFDPDGKSNKHFGIKFPVGSGGPMRGGPGGAGGRRGMPRDRDDQGTRDGGVIEPPGRLELLGPKKDEARSLVLEYATGIAVRIGQSDGSLFYELRVPLMTSAEFPYAIGAKAGALIGVGLETPKVERSPEEGRGMGMPGGMGGGGRGGGGRGGGGRGMGGGGGSRDGFTPPKPLKAWGVVKLATS